MTVVALIASSGYSKSPVGVFPGDIAPEVRIDTDSAFSLSSTRGRYVLLTFWSSTDANSRQACNHYTSLANELGDKLQHVSVNFDTDPQLFNEIVRRDGLGTESQFNVQGEQAARIAQDYHLEGGFGTVLINPDGRIGTINPSDHELLSLK